ncbi:HipA domain-containing protein [Ruminococcus sp.]|uniref:HipA domain-containing protein n=1 Tax=Ruminococcus sp. TaxID=41978 RepID=UPI0025F4CA41|nr:HipA domain-containing protein [Ruminococcus sp.]
MKWENVNFFDNEFSDDIGDVLFGTSTKSSGFDFYFPDNTSDGNLKKRWKIMDGKRCLLKAGSRPYRQQPYNEVIASIVMDRLGVDHVPYRVINIGNEPFSICEDFITKDTELVSAHRILQIRSKENHENDYLHYINTCKEIGVDISAAVDDMIVVDYIIANEDRHFNNFGLLRNAETLEWIGAAPIYDSGTSLWFDRSEDQIKNAEIKCKPFKKHHSEQIKLVPDFSRYDFSKLDGIENDIREVLKDQKAERVELICEAVRKRIETLQLLAVQQNAKEANSFNDEYTEEVTAEEYNINMD